MQILILIMYMWHLWHNYWIFFRSSSIQKQAQTNIYVICGYRIVFIELIYTWPLFLYFRWTSIIGIIWRLWHSVRAAFWVCSIYTLALFIVVCNSFRVILTFAENVCPLLEHIHSVSDGSFVYLVHMSISVYSW